jgi:pimeloyl-ACP methyl ester carboxylesterase
MTVRETVVEAPRWFGPPDRPLFGWVARPAGGTAIGGLLIAPTLGREARAGRRALRALAKAAAERGFVALRIDYDGTGDSSGSLDEPGRDLAFVDSVRHGVELLRSFGVPNVAAVGMRLGATVAGCAAATHELDLSALVLWDPCESGRNYLRELAALEALRRDHVQLEANGSVATAEHVFERHTAEELRRLDLTTIDERPIAARILVMPRPDRAPSAKFRRRFETDHSEVIEHRTAIGQGALLDVDPLFAALPTSSIIEIVDWLSTTAPAPTEVRIDEGPREARFASGDGDVVERIVELGEHRLFGIVSEPSGGAPNSPLVCFVNVSNEDHTGPSRLWVELSRCWSGHGLRCLRFDLSGLGDSPEPADATSSVYEQAWLADTVEAVRGLTGAVPSNSVLVGLCSGAFWAVEAGLALGSRGVCVINPPVGIDFLHGVTKLGNSRFAPVRALAERLKEVSLRLRWVAVVLWKALRVLAPSVFSVDVMKRLVEHGTDLQVLASSEELSPYPKYRSLDRFFSRRLVVPANYQVTFVPSLDHSLHDATGRSATIALLDHHVLEHFATAAHGGGDTDPDAKERQ